MGYRVVAVLGVFLGASACASHSSFDRNAVGRLSATMHMDLHEIEDLGWHPIGTLPFLVQDGDALILDSDSQVILSTPARLSELDPQVPHERFAGTYYYLLSGPRFAVFGSGIGLGYCEDLAVESKKGTAVVIRSAVALKEFASKHAYDFHYTTEREQLARWLYRRALDRLAWSPAQGGSVLRAWAALKTGPGSTAILDVTFARPQSPSEATGARRRITLPERSVIFLTPDEIVEAQVTEVTGDAVYADGQAALEPIYQLFPVISAGLQ